MSHTRDPPANPLSPRRPFVKVSVPCIAYVFVVASSGPYVKGVSVSNAADSSANTSTSAAGDLTTYDNSTISQSHTESCAEMAGRETDGAILDVAKTLVATGGSSFLVAYAGTVNSVALARILSC